MQIAGHRCIKPCNYFVVCTFLAPDIKVQVSLCNFLYIQCVSAFECSLVSPAIYGYRVIHLANHSQHVQYDMPLNSTYMKYAHIHTKYCIKLDDLQEAVAT